MAKLNLLPVCKFSEFRVFKHINVDITEETPEYQTGECNTIIQDLPYIKVHVLPAATG